MFMLRRLLKGIELSYLKFSEKTYLKIKAQFILDVNVIILIFNLENKFN